MIAYIDKNEADRGAKDRIDDMAEMVIEEMQTKGVRRSNAQDMEIGIQIVMMEAQRAILNELILIREKLESESSK